MSKRKSLSKRTRFEVFKRDKFTCQYCGRKSPDVILNCDHVLAVAAGGKNGLLNLITSCEDCNNGKGARHLSDDTALSKQRTQLEVLQEKREQLEMMLRWQRGLIDLEAKAVESVAAMYQALVPGWSLNENGLATLRKLISAHGVEATTAALRAAASAYVQMDGGRATGDSSADVVVAWQKSLRYKAMRQRDPVGSELRYIRGILRNRLTYCPMESVLARLEDAYERGVPMETLERLALRTGRSILTWEAEMAGLVSAATEGGDDDA